MKRCMNMYEDKYKNIGMAAGRDLSKFLNLLADLNEELELFALGGTAMVLKGIKESTRDIDFITTEPYSKIKRLFGLAGLKEEQAEKVCNIWRLDKVRIDIFYDGFILGVPFPDDWKQLSEKLQDIGKVRIFVLNWYDLIITKVARSETRDIDDVLAILKSQKIDFQMLKKRYYTLAETALIGEFDYKFKHMEEAYARSKTH